jgi:hypothetical protein
MRRNLRGRIQNAGKLIEILNEITLKTAAPTF